MTASAHAKASTWSALLRALRGAVRPGEPGLFERLRSVPRMVRAVLHGEYEGTTGWRLLGLVAALVYVVSPFDLVPEALTVVLGPLGLLGFADDAVVVAWLAARLLGETDDYLRWERTQQVRGGRAGGRSRRRGTSRGGHAAHPGGPDVVPGEVLR